MTTDHHIADLARRFAAARDLAQGLRAARNAHVCEHEMVGIVEGGLNRTPCWKLTPDPDPDNAHRRIWLVQPDEWCAGCCARVAEHRRYMLAKRRAAGQLSALLRATRT